VKVPNLSFCHHHYGVFRLPKREKKLPKTAALLKKVIAALAGGDYTVVGRSGYGHGAAISISVSTRASDRMAARRVRLKVPSEI